MQFNYLLLSGLFFLLLAGCEKERFYENIYEGIQKREQIASPSNEPIPKEHQSYDTYKRERAEVLQKEETAKE